MYGHSLTSTGRAIRLKTRALLARDEEETLLATHDTRCHAVSFLTKNNLFHQRQTADSLTRADLFEIFEIFLTPVPNVFLVLM